MPKIWTASEMGKKGGLSKSPRKLAAIKINAQKAGRPRLPDDQVKPESLKRRQKRSLTRI